MTLAGPDRNEGGLVGRVRRSAVVTGSGASLVSSSP